MHASRVALYFATSYGPPSTTKRFTGSLGRRDECVLGALTMRMTFFGLDCVLFVLSGHKRTESDRQTVLVWDTNPHTPRLYFKPAPPLRPHATGTYRDNISSSWMWKGTTPHPLGPSRRLKLKYPKDAALYLAFCEKCFSITSVSHGCQYSPPPFVCKLPGYLIFTTFAFRHSAETCTTGTISSPRDDRITGWFSGKLIKLTVHHDVSCL